MPWLAVGAAFRYNSGTVTDTAQIGAEHSNGSL